MRYLNWKKQISELVVEPTQPSLRENSEIGVFNREGETDIEMPSQLQVHRRSRIHGTFEFHSI